MAIPLKQGYHINVEWKKLPYNYEMKMTQVYSDYYSITYIISGDRKLITPDFIEILHGGDIGFTKKNLYHRSTFLSEKDYECIQIKFSEKMINDFIKLIGRYAFDELFESPVHHVTPEQSQFVFHICKEMHEEFNHYDRYSEIVLKGLLHKLIITVMRNRLPDHRDRLVNRKGNVTIMEAVYYMETHYREAPTLYQTAEAVHLSPYYFSKLFKATIGCTYTEYLNSIKLQHVKTLLINTKLSISEIALLCGYSNGNYLCDVFRNMEGVSPLQYRKKMLAS